MKKWPKSLGKLNKRKALSIDRALVSDISLKIYLGELVLFGQGQVQDEESAAKATSYIRECVESILKKRGVFTTEEDGEGVARLNMAITGTETTKEALGRYGTKRFW